MVEKKPVSALRQRIHWIPDVNLGSVVNLIAIVVAVVSITGYIGTIDAKANNNAASVARTETSIAALSSSVEARRLEDKADITKQLDRIERKVDKLSP